MSFGSIFRFQQQASAIVAEPGAAFHPTLDPDASARLASMDRHFHREDAPAVETSNEPAADEIDINDPLAILMQTIDPSANAPVGQGRVEAAPEVAAEEIAAESVAPEEFAQKLTAPAVVAEETVAQESAVEEVAAETLAADADVAATEPAIESTSDCTPELEIESLHAPAAVETGISIETAEASSATETGSAADEIDLAPVVAIQLTVSETIPDVEVNGIFRAAVVATEIILHPPATEAVAEDIRALETEIETEIAETPATENTTAVDANADASQQSPTNSNSEFSAHAQADADADAVAPAPLEVTPILDASGELDLNADAYVPPPPFEIHVPDSLALEATPKVEAPAPGQSPAELADDLLAAQEFEVAQALAAAPQLKNLDQLPASVPAAPQLHNIDQDPAGIDAGVTKNAAENAADLVETFDLDSLCAPTADEQMAAQQMGQAIDKVIAQEEAVAEMNAAAEEFVAEQIACEQQTGHPCPPPAESTDGVPSSSKADAPVSIAGSPLESAAAALKAEPASDRRRKRRALISSPIRVRGIDVTTAGPDEIATTVDVSRYGILFHTVLDTYQRGMDVAVVFPYHKSATGAQTEQFGRVVRLHEMPDGRQAVAIALGVGIGEHLVDASGRKLEDQKVHLSNSPAPPVKRPMVLIVDSDDMLRDTSKIFLQNEGYEVIAVNNAGDAREVLNMFTPAMIVAEIEGAADSDVLPGLDLCAHVKSSPSLRHIPVVMTSRSAYPSDYSNAHSLGAVVCMAKPYKQERLAHVVHLLAPLPEHLQPACTQRPPDPTRGFTRDSNVTTRNGNGKSRNGNGKKPATNAAAALLKKSFKFPNFR